MFQKQQQEDKNRVLVSAKYPFSSDTTCKWRWDLAHQGKHHMATDKVTERVNCFRLQSILEDHFFEGHKYVLRPISITYIVIIFEL